MPRERPLVSVVSPAFEEEQSLPAFHAALTESLNALHDELAVEIIYVDDGSCDRTFEVIEGISRTDHRVRGLALSRNFGHQAALTAGLEHARGDAVVMLDSDLQHPPALIPVLVQHWRAGFDVVQTIRADDARLSWIKRATSAAFYKLLGRFSDLEVRPAASDFRLLSRRALDSLLRLNESHRYLRGMVQWLGFRSIEVPFAPNERHAGVSKYTFRKMLRLAFDGLYSFSRAPIRMAIAVGLVATAFSLAASLGWAFSSRLGLWPIAALVAAHGVAAAAFASVGAVGEYLGRIYEQGKQRPHYLIKADTAADAGHVENSRPLRRAA